MGIDMEILMYLQWESSYLDQNQELRWVILLEDNIGSLVLM